MCIGAPMQDHVGLFQFLDEPLASGEGCGLFGGMGARVGKAGGVSVGGGVCDKIGGQIPVDHRGVRRVGRPNAAERLHHRA